MPKTDHVELPDGTRIPILFEDRGVLALDKPAGWMLGPEDEEHVRHNLHLALMEGIARGQWWARCRNLRFIRFVHRLDAPTTGILLMVKSPGAIRPFTELFSSRGIEKTYLAVTDGLPREERWRCQLALGPVPEDPGRHRVDPIDGKESDTAFQRLEVRGNRALVEAKPHTGRTHQIRLHLRAAGCPVVGDVLYGEPDAGGLALRAVGLQYRDPFTGKPVRIRASDAEFKKRFGFGPVPPGGTVPPPGPATVAANPEPRPPVAPRGFRRPNPEPFRLPFPTRPPERRDGPRRPDARGAAFDSRPPGRDERQGGPNRARPARPGGPDYRPRPAASRPAPGNPRPPTPGEPNAKAAGPGHGGPRPAANRSGKPRHR